MQNKDTFSGYHPLINFFYFALVLVFAMFFTHPASQVISLLTALAYCAQLNGRRAMGRSLLWLLPMMLTAVVVNPAFNHEGATILTYLPTGNPLTLENAIERLEAVVPVAEYVRSCVDIPKFLGFCRECPNYGNRWSCPPFQEDPMTVWSRFASLRLVAYALPNEPGQDVPTALDNMKLAKDRMMAELLEQELLIPGSFALSAGTCTLCGDHCTRTEGKPCRKPEQMRYSIEALGGDVSRTAELYLKKPILWIKDNVLPDYLMLVGGLLLKRQED